MRQSINILVLLLILFMQFCEEDKNPIIQKDYGEGNEYLIYKLILNDMFLETGYTVILCDSTEIVNIPINQRSSIKEKIPELLYETLDDLVSKDSRGKLKDIFGVGFYIFSSQYTDKKDSTVSVQLSEVGYNTLETQAVVAMDVIYAPLVGEGILFYLEYQDNEWIIKSRFTLWIA